MNVGEEELMIEGCGSHFELAAVDDEKVLPSGERHLAEECFGLERLLARLLGRLQLLLLFSQSSPHFFCFTHTKFNENKNVKVEIRSEAD